MPKGPRGEKRPADVIGAAVLVGKIATGEITEVPAVTGGRVHSGRAGAAARSKALPAERRSEVARAAAAARWHGTTESVMEENENEMKATPQPARAISMYPDNQLGPQRHQFEDTFTMSTAVQRAMKDFDKD